jgi:DNA repair exonuclease SbcCD ATPase subunit
MSKKTATLDELTKQYNVLNERKIQAETQLKEAEKRLLEMQTQAQKEFGTNDIAELQARLEQLEAENETRRADYQALLEGIQTDLKNIESPAPTDD